MLFGILLCCAAVMQSQACSNLFPYLNSPTVITAGDDIDFVVPCPMGQAFPFYGTSHSTTYTSINGWVAMTNPGCSCYTAIHTAAGGGLSGTPYLSVFWADQDLNTAGTLYIKKINGGTEPVVDALVTAAAASIGETLVADVIFIATWDGVGRYLGISSSVNIHQIVIASNGVITISIFNYDRIDWYQTSDGAAIQFSKGDDITWAPLSISGTSQSQYAPCYTNIGIPGRIVTRVDGGTITAPTITCIQNACRKCTVDLSNGGITTFDQDTSLSATLTNRRYLISKPEQPVNGSTNPCKFMLRMVTDSSGVLDLLRFNVGVLPNDATKYELQLNFNFGTNTWKSKGSLGTGVFIPPYTETLTGGEMIRVDLLDGCYMIWSPDCDYKVRVCDDKVEMLVLSNEYDGTLIGMCQDGDGDDSNDTVDCDVCDTCGSPSGVADTCSCPKNPGGSPCNEFLRKL